VEPAASFLDCESQEGAMRTAIDIRFPGGVAVDAEMNGFTIHTDQPLDHGGEGSGPAPFDLFLASIGTCAGFYALRFCQERKIATAGLVLRMTHAKEPAGVGSVRLELTLPAGFPDKYVGAVVRAMEQCAVKRALLDPPVFEVVALPAPQRFSNVIAAEFMQ